MIPVHTLLRFRPALEIGRVISTGSGNFSYARRVSRTANCASTTSNSLQASCTSPLATGTSSPAPTATESMSPAPEPEGSSPGNPGSEFPHRAVPAAATPRSAARLPFRPPRPLARLQRLPPGRSCPSFPLPRRTASASRVRPRSRRPPPHLHAEHQARLPFLLANSLELSNSLDSSHLSGWLE